MTDTCFTQEIPPTISPVSLNNAKSYLRIGNNNEDDIIQNMLSSSIEYAEKYIECSLAPQTWKLSIYNRWITEVQLKYGPVQEIVNVKIFNNDADFILSTNEYSLENNCNIINFHTQYASEKIEILYNTGYNNNNIPAQIIQGILMHTSLSYHTRDNLNINNTPLFRKIHALYDTYKMIDITL